MRTRSSGLYGRECCQHTCSCSVARSRSRGCTGHAHAQQRLVWACMLPTHVQLLCGQVAQQGLHRPCTRAAAAFVWACMLPTHVQLLCGQVAQQGLSIGRHRACARVAAAQMGAHAAACAPRPQVIQLAVARSKRALQERPLHVTPRAACKQHAACSSQSMQVGLIKQASRGAAGDWTEPIQPRTADGMTTHDYSRAYPPCYHRGACNDTVSLMD